MNIYFRLIYFIVIGLLRQPRVSVRDECVTSFTVLPNDLDANFHMNNGRYLSIMDLARCDYIGKNGLLRVAVRNRWRPVVGNAAVSYYRPLKLFQRYRITTRLEYWDEKWVVLSQSFERRGSVVARAFVRGLFIGPKGRVRSSDLLSAMGNRDLQPPPTRPEVRKWLEGLS